MATQELARPSIGGANTALGATNPETLTTWLLNSQHALAPTARGSLTILLNSICVACKYVQNAVRKAGLAGMLGLAGDTNVQGEDQKKLDVLANEAFVNILSRCGQCGLLVSEEDEAPTVVPAATAGPYAVVFDPLDGSSNIDCAVSIGTIYGIFKLPDRGGAPPPADGADVLVPGARLVAAGYCLYGSSCAMVLSVNRAPPSVFTLDPPLGEFVLTADRVTVPRAGSIFSINEGNACRFDAGTAAAVAAFKAPPAAGGKPKSARYVGSMVADVHRTLLYGGIFCYPSDTASRRGKLRLLYEGAPMAYIMEAAGGAAIAGPGIRVLDVVPSSVHARIPVFLGSADDVAAVEAALATDKDHLQLRSTKL